MHPAEMGCSNLGISDRHTAVVAAGGAVALARIEQAPNCSTKCQQGLWGDFPPKTTPFFCVMLVWMKGTMLTWFRLVRAPNCSMVMEILLPLSVFAVFDHGVANFRLIRNHPILTLDPPYPPWSL